MQEFDPAVPNASELNEALQGLERTKAGQRFLEKIDRQIAPDFVPALFNDARQYKPEQHPAISLAIVLISLVPQLHIDFPRLEQRLGQELRELELPELEVRELKEYDRLSRLINAARPAFAIARAVVYQCFR